METPAGQSYEKYSDHEVAPYVHAEAGTQPLSAVEVEEANILLPIPEEEGWETDTAERRFPE